MQRCAHANANCILSVLFRPLGVFRRHVFRSAFLGPAPSTTRGRSRSSGWVAAPPARERERRASAASGEAQGRGHDASSSSKASSSKGKGSGRRWQSARVERRDVIVLFALRALGRVAGAAHRRKLNIPHISVGGIMRDAIEERTPSGSCQGGDGGGRLDPRRRRRRGHPREIAQGLRPRLRHGRLPAHRRAGANLRRRPRAPTSGSRGSSSRLPTTSSSEGSWWWQHKTSGRLYHAATAPPGSAPGATPSVANMLDDETGEPPCDA